MRCTHPLKYFEVRPRDSGHCRQWEVRETCSRPNCAGIGDNSVRHFNRRSAVRTARCKAQQRANDTNRAVQISYVGRFNWIRSQPHVVWPESCSPDLIRVRSLRYYSLVAVAVVAIAVGTYTLRELTSQDDDLLGWVNDVIGVYAIAVSVIVAAAMSTLSQLASDHDGPWVARRHLMTRSAGMVVQGMTILGALLVATIVSETLIRYLTLSLSFTLSVYVVWDLIMLARRLTSYAAEARMDQQTS